MDYKRVRSSNFSVTETRTLVDVALDFKHIIENKRTDTIGIKDKSEAWNNIERIFNSRSDVNRCAKTLKMKYDALKKGLKKKVAEHKRQIYMTDGGPPADLTLPDYEGKLLDIIYLNVEDLSSRHDSDPLNDQTTCTNTNNSSEIDFEGPIVKIENTMQIENIICDVDQELSTSEPESSGTNSKHHRQKWSDHLKSKKSNILHTNRSRTANNQEKISKFKELAVVKKELVSLQIEMLKKEIELKQFNNELEMKKAEEQYEFTKKEQNLKLEILQKELQEKENAIQRNKEEHVLRMKILTYDLKEKERNFEQKKTN